MPASGVELPGVMRGAPGELPAVELPPVELPGTEHPPRGPLPTAPPPAPQPPQPAPRSVEQSGSETFGARPPGARPPAPRALGGVPAKTPPAVVSWAGRLPRRRGKSHVPGSAKPVARAEARSSARLRQRTKRAAARPLPSRDLALVAASPAARTVAVADTARPSRFDAELASLRDGSTNGPLALILALLAGAAVIAAMCADALGVGPRHDYLRRARRSSGRWLRWR